MRRVSASMMNDDMRFWLARKEDAMTRMSNKKARQERLENLRDDPMAAAHAVRYDSFAMRLQRFEKNVQYAQDKARITEGYMRQTQEIMQRVRELAVTGANGTFSKQDTQAMAEEVDQLLAELVQIANARGPDGDFIFAGDKAKTEPFRAVSGSTPDAGHSVTSQVLYMGGIDSSRAEITQNAYIDMNIPGDSVFWAERQRIAGSANASSYRALEASSIFINGQEIAIKPGDTANAIIARINDSGAAVKASLDPANNTLVLEGTQARRIQLDESGNVLRDLGILSGSKVPNDYAVTARVSGGSLFDSVMNLRDALYAGNQTEISGRSLASIDAAMDNMNRRLAEIGSVMERLESTALRLNKEIPDVTKLLADEKDLDLTQAITEFKMMEYTHEASLRMAGKVLPQTLLDFLR